ncbi:aldehyde dehydrogenase family protein [Yaniella halotolerans]|uniref:aldehyde dehydrogenase family protein n=1 Tax=Yaniella halotolerans TaxID=225453 RepID=UPI0003B422E2|nr:aldehyde dehydrogenase family protein [Yaniella halotolerans]
MSAATTIAEVQQVYASGRTRSVAWRLSQLAALQQLLEDNGPTLEAALAQDLGKNGFEAWVSEIGQVLTEIRWLRKHTAPWAKPQRVRTPLALWPAKSMIEHEPRGTVLIIAPWNYPVMLGLSPLAGAVAAGNAVVLKPSEVGSAVETVLQELIPYYLDPHAIRVVTGGPDVVHEMIDARPDYVFFTGSPKVGSIIATACAERLIEYTLELGGQSPAYVHHDADLATAASRLVWSKYLNAGQTCVAPNHIYAHESIAEDLVTAMIKEVRRQFGKDHARDPSYPRMITADHTKSLVELLAETAGDVVYGGNCTPSKRYFDPTIVTNVNEDDALMSRELFGPVLPVITVNDADDALDRIAKRENPLAFYLFTQSEALKDHVLPRIVAGGIGINVPLMHLATPHMPFGGVGSSGHGRYHGIWSLRTFSHERAVLDKPVKPDTLKLVKHPAPFWAHWAVRKLLTGGYNPGRDLARARSYRNQPLD